MDSNISVITSSVGAFTTLLGAALGAIATILYGVHKSKLDRLADARVKQFESIRDAALSAEREYWKLQAGVQEAVNNGSNTFEIECNLQRLLMEYLKEVFFQCRRAELSIIDKEAGELLLKTEQRSTVQNIGELAINNYVPMSHELVLNYSMESLDQLRKLTKLCRDRATGMDRKSPWVTTPKPDFWSYADEHKKNNPSDGGLYT